MQFLQVPDQVADERLERLRIYFELLQVTAADPSNPAAIQQQQAMEAQYEAAQKALIDYVFNVYLYLQEMQLVPVIDAISAEDPQISQLLA